MFNLTKPSQLLTAAIDGMTEAMADPNFKFNMATFGSTTDTGLCCGCVATVTMQKLGNIKFTPDIIFSREDRAKALGQPWHIIDVLEDVIDNARLGSYETLCDLFNVTPLDDDDYDAFAARDLTSIIARFTKLRDQLVARGD